MIMMNPVRIREAHKIQPILGHMFAVLRLGQQAIDQPFVGACRGIGQKAANVFTGRGQAREIQAQPSNQGAAVCGGTRREPFRLK